MKRKLCREIREVCFDIDTGDILYENVLMSVEEVEE